MSFHGAWWFEDDPEHRFYGVAEFGPSDGWRLKARGDRIPLDPSWPRPGRDFVRRNLIGHCDDRTVALLDAYSVTLPFEQPVTSAEIRSSVGLVGRTAPTGWRFDRLTITSEALDEWAQFGWLTPGGILPVRPASIPLEWPTDHPVELPDSSLTLWVADRIDVDRTSVTASARPQWLFEPEAPATLLELADAAVRPLDYLHVVCTGHNLGEWTIEVHQGDESWQQLFAASRRPGHGNEVHSALFAYQLVPFEQRVATWFESYGVMSRALHPLMSVLTDEHRNYMETRTVLLTHGLEAYHRAHPRLSNEAADVEDVQRMKASLKASLDQETFRWVGKHLVHAEEPSFKERVESVIDYVGPLGHELTSGRRFSAMTREVRDALAHGLEQPRKGLEEWRTRMRDVYFTLNAVLRVALLRDLGLTPDEADTAGRRLNAVQFALQRAGA